ncbi:Amidohydrolase [Novosphingobium sp. CF614]|uniref:amidohydrolase family protein n=1 Tax=Novosphingobium sp. CF614 TaxID=1884364 RepID=UPI0008EE001C|nr:amidohydrolase family protein [Novosphingobium sp. CF614]SFF82724.1 Amidohydrolase [Novosphingobium sp. CF614]
MEKLVIASADSHAGMPPELWAEYLEPKYHKYLARLRDEHRLFGDTMQMLCDLRTPDAARPIFDRDGCFERGHLGLWDLDVRLAQMDREGIAAELVFPGDFRSFDMFWNTVNGTYSLAAVDAGARGFNRWCADAFGSAGDRLLLIGAPLSGLDRQAVLDEADFMAGHGFAGVFTPGYCALPTQIPVFEAEWDPVFAAYAERNLTLITHAGYGIPQGFMFSEVEAAAAEVKAEDGGPQDLIRKLTTTVFNDSGVFADLRSRQGLWQFMLGGVFDRHPALKMMVTEIRADWIPATLALLDRVWERNRDRLPARRAPSEYWGTNCIAGLSFMNKAELAMRHEIGVETMAFGRDYPHGEGTWPNTIDYFADIFQGVPEKEVRAILGGNMIRFLGLDPAHLAAIAERIDAPTYREIAEKGSLSQDLAAHLAMRCGYAKPSEGDRRVAEMEPLLERDIPRLAAAGSAWR